MVFAIFGFVMALSSSPVADSQSRPTRSRVSCAQDEAVLRTHTIQFLRLATHRPLPSSFPCPGESSRLVVLDICLEIRSGRIAELSVVEAPGRTAVSPLLESMYRWKFRTAPVSGFLTAPLVFRIQPNTDTATCRIELA
jgi:hypothetical protein